VLLDSHKVSATKQHHWQILIPDQVFAMDSPISLRLAFLSDDPRNVLFTQSKPFSKFFIGHILHIQFADLNVSPRLVDFG